ncbi:hypothetical protein HKCCE2091_17265 [Rhodobacterales bacterium HKCCE2091]|nr:hypothetical protein [Rhodobacterales bacterium HKCCE2091]
MIRSLAAFLLSAAPALAQVAPGFYDAPVENDLVCTEISDGRLEIRENGEIRFYESLCSIANPIGVSALNGAVLYEAQCAGEGEEWTTAVMLMPGLEEDYMVMVFPGYATTYRRCPG